MVTCLSAAPVSPGLHRAPTQVPGGTRLCCGSHRLRTLLRAQHPKGGTSGCPVSPGQMLPHVVLKEAGGVLQRCHRSSQSESCRSRAESPLGWCEHQLSHTHHTATLAVTSRCLQGGTKSRRGSARGERSRRSLHTCAELRQSGLAACCPRRPACHRLSPLP